MHGTDNVPPIYDERQEVIKGQQVTAAGYGASSEYQTLDRATIDWEVAPYQVSIIKMIGKGAFGQTAKATAVNIRGIPGESTVAVKMLKGM